ncbi:hypothetical protein ACSNOK_31980 [Streptomyces sp. URMC 126]|uniref:hypothetical protein n=1 Tax=Streptomyces sp. URMC 126 TaxID=3423401 RepID=UPI003F1C8114
MERASGVPGVSQQRAANLRLVALAAAVALAVVLPLAAATAGPAAPAGRPEAGPERKPSGSRPAAVRKPVTPVGKVTDEIPRDALTGAAGALAGDGWKGAGGSSSPARPAAPDEPPAVTRCGPELDTPDGLEAQTCVLTEGAETWARTYYRNGTDAPVTGVLTLMAPDGGSLQTRCPMPATDTPDTCETPRRRTVRGHGAYAAVAEIASADGKLLLRSGGNSSEPGED